MAKTPPTDPNHPDTPEDTPEDAPDDRPEGRPENAPENALENSPELASKDATPPIVEDESLAQVQREDRAAALLEKTVPWAVSLLLHVAILMLAFFSVWAVQQPVDEDEVIIPNTNLSKTPGVPIQIRKSRVSKTKRSSSSRRSVRSTRRSTSISKSKTRSKTKLIGVQGASAAAASPFEMSNQNDQAFNVTVFGNGGNAKKVVYVIDASGSLIGYLEFVISELKKSINKLNEKQSFTVIFFQGENKPRESPPKGLQPANQTNKSKAIAWISQIPPLGPTNPVQAITLALKYRPQLVILLSDNITGSGLYEVDQFRLINAILQANEHHTKISTIQYIFPDPLEAQKLTGTMQRIAQTNGGTYKFVNARELGLEEPVQ